MKLLRWLPAAALAFSLFFLSATEKTAELRRYRDVRPDSELAEAADWAVGNGLDSPTSETDFSPDWTLTRAELAGYFYRYAYLPEPKYTSGEALNAGDWQFLEKKVRSWAKRYGSIFVVTGPIVDQNRYGTIGDRDVVVPDAFYKALLVRRDDGSYSSIAFVMGNDDDRYYLKDCKMTVDELENLTGFDFFPGLDDKIEEKVESKIKLSDWGIK